MKRKVKDLSKLYYIVNLLAHNKILETRYKNHKLIGNYVNKFECHIEPDWLLIYGFDMTQIILYRTGNHTDLFNM